MGPLQSQHQTVWVLIRCPRMLIAIKRRQLKTWLCWAELTRCSFKRILCPCWYFQISQVTFKPCFSIIVIWYTWLWCILLCMVIRHLVHSQAWVFKVTRESVTHYHCPYYLCHPSPLSFSCCMLTSLFFLENIGPLLLALCSCCPCPLECSSFRDLLGFLLRSNVTLWIRACLLTLYKVTPTRTSSVSLQLYFSPWLLLPPDI